MCKNYIMPGEFEEHSGCIIIWPERPGSWGIDPTKARVAFKSVIDAICKSERVYLIASSTSIESARASFAHAYYKDRVKLLCIESDDAWARDVAPTFVKDRESGEILGLDWCFNAWGGEYDGLYAHWEKDDKLASSFLEAENFKRKDMHPFVLEGGSIHSDGEGTVMVTEACLLSKGRNPDLTKREIEDKLKAFLGAKKVLWLPHGIYQDETNEHIDNVCAFVKPGEVVLAWTDDKNDPQYEYSKADLEYLESETDAKGRKLKVYKLYIPKVPVCINEEDLKGYCFEEGEDKRELFERLCASYVNFYIANKAVVVPKFFDENDEKAEVLLKKLFPEREIIMLPARDILLGGGNIHCITQQIPKGDKNA